MGLCEGRSEHPARTALTVSVAGRYRHRVVRRRRDRWAVGPALSLPEAAYGGPVYDLAEPDPVLAWVTFRDRSLEVEARVIAYTERAVLVEGGLTGRGVRVGVARRC